MHPAFVAGLAARLAPDPVVGRQRVEVIEPRTHWAQTRLADVGVTPARGWLRQIDEQRNPLFYQRAPLTGATYRAWLDAHAVAYVALPHGVPLDFGSGAEASLVARGLPYLRAVYADPQWTLYAVDDPAPLATGPARVTALPDTGVVLQASAPGDVRLSLWYSPLLVVDGGAVRAVPGEPGETEVHLDSAGRHVVHGVWRLP